MRGWGCAATCNPGGAGKWRDDYVTPLTGKRVVILPDRDPVGRSHAQTIAASLCGKVESLRVLEVPTGKDLTEYLETFDGDDEAALERLAIMAEGAEEWEPSLETATSEAPAGGPPAPIMELLTLRERLARPVEPLEWRIEGWQPARTRVVLAAQFKAGKTVLVGNLVRSLLDGDPFLGHSAVHPVAGCVALLDLEMGEVMLDGWLRAQAIRHDDRLLVAPLRGRLASLDLLDDAKRSAWAKLLRDRGVEYLVFDCLRPALDSLGLDEHREAGRFLVAFDELLQEAGIPEALVVHHFGHGPERSRGDSRLRDWPDVEWRLDA